MPRASVGDQVDLYAGSTIRARRKARGLTQTQFGQKLGVSFQQVQKYENGSNRISATMLVLIAEVLQTPILELLPQSEFASAQSEKQSSALSIHGAQELLAAYSGITNDRDRKALRVLATLLLRKDIDQRDSDIVGKETTILEKLISELHRVDQH